MFEQLSRPITRALLIFAFSLPVLGFISVLIETNHFLSASLKSDLDVLISSDSDIAALSDDKQQGRITETRQADAADTTQLIAEEPRYQLIYISNFPVEEGYLSSGYGMRKDPISGKRRMHHGVDIAARKGEKIYPIGDGEVIFVGRKAGYGRMVEIRHGRTIVSRYTHLKKYRVKKGQQVTEKDIIGQVGSSGRSTGPHLHLEIAINGETVDPQTFLIGGLASN